MSRLYVAYGSNLGGAQMLHRCAGARRVATLMLPGWRLEVRRFARIAADRDAACPVALWRVTAAPLAALDRFEGHPRIYSGLRS